MTIKHWPEQEKPREKLLFSGPTSLSDAELLAIFLRTGVPGKTAVDLARDLINSFGSLRDLLAASRKEFCSHHGLGLAKYAQLQAILEMARRHMQEILQREDVLSNSYLTKQYLIARLRDHQQEVFACLFLDARNRVIAYDELFFGTINSSSVHPREVVKRALQHNAASVILAHNHPSGNPEPSRADKDVTLQLQKSLSLVEVRLLDHVVVGDGECVSFVERGMFSTNHSCMIPD